jgi:hypothetical protein
LLKFGQIGSAADLAERMLNIYESENMPVSELNKCMSSPLIMCGLSEFVSLFSSDCVLKLLEQRVLSTSSRRFLYRTIHI